MGGLVGEPSGSGRRPDLGAVGPLLRRGWAGFTSWPIATRVATSSAVVLGVLAIVLLVALASWRSYGEQVGASRSEAQDQLAETEAERDELASEVDALSAEVDGLREDLADAESQIEAAEQRAEDAEETARAELRNEVEAEFEDREAELDARAAALQQRADELDGREADISEAEQREEMSTFGSGVWAVGEDILAGQYRAADAGGSCYWARLHQDGSSIIDNHYSGEPGPVLATVHEGELFETSGCGEWRRRG